MAVYKVIQDVEAEDKLLGPLTLKGFAYAGIAVFCAFINYRLLLIASPLKWLFILLFLIPMLLFGVLASPLGREQPTEVWLLSRLKFFLKPRSRIWDQMGSQELVKITAPKKAEMRLTKDLSPTEVQSRLKTLALTLDTRGWAIKNTDINLSGVPPGGGTETSDRLIAATVLPHETPVVDVHAADDIMDEHNNPTAQKFAAMMQKADAARKHGILASLKDLVDNDEESSEEPAPLGALTRAGGPAKALRSRRKAEEDEELQRKLAEARNKFSTEHSSAKKSGNTRHKLLMKRVGAKTTAKKDAKKIKRSTVTAARPSGIDDANLAKSEVFHRARQAVNMELAQSGSAFSVATLSRLANRQPKIEQTGPDEVTISLH